MLVNISNSGWRNCAYQERTFGSTAPGCNYATTSSLNGLSTTDKLTGVILLFFLAVILATPR